jgi:hypothetical protein
MILDDVDLQPRRACVEAKLISTTLAYTGVSEIPVLILEKTRQFQNASKIFCPSICNKRAVFCD